MALDPNIPLMGTPPVNALELAKAQGVGMELRQRQQDVAAQDAIRNVFANPDSINPATGTLRPEAIRNVFAASPAAGIKLMDQMQAQELHRAQISHYNALTQQEQAAAAQKRQESALKILPHIIDINSRMNVLYDQRVAAGASPEQARQDALGIGNEQVDGLAQSAVLGGQSEIDRFKQGVASWDRTKSGVMVQRSKDILAAQLAQQKAEQKQEERPAKWTAEGLAFRPGTNTALEVYDQQQGWRPFTGTVPTDLKLIGGPEVAMYTNVTPPSGSTPAVGLSKTSGQFENIPTKPGTQIPTGIKGDISLSGQEYMDSLPPEQQDLVKGIAEGRINPTTFSTKGGHRENIMAMVTRYDPSYNQTRPATWKEFTTGATARNITSINTSLSHMDNMYDLADAMKNNDVRLANAVLNRLATETGRPEITNFEVARQAVGDELMRTFRQVGASEIEAKDWRDRFASAGSPEQLKGAIKTAGKLLQGRLDAVNQQWKRGTQLTTDFPDIVSPQNQNVLAKIGVSKSTGVSPASGMPAVGEVRSGYRFKGGDPAKQESWEKI